MQAKQRQPAVTTVEPIEKGGRTLEESTLWSIHRGRQDSGPASAKRFYTVPKAAELLRVSEVTLYREIREARFPAIKIRNRYVVPAKAIDELEQDALASSAQSDHGRSGSSIVDGPGHSPAAATLRGRTGMRPDRVLAARWSASETQAAYTRRVVAPPPPCPRRPATVRGSTPAEISSVAE